MKKMFSRMISGEKLNVRAHFASFFSFDLMFCLIFCHFFLQSIVFIRGDCLKFVDESLKTNECSIQTISNETTNVFPHYSQCLICRIENETFLRNVTLEKENRCLTIELRCVQMIFPTRNVFEEFFLRRNSLIDELFFRNNRIDQNTLHLIFKEKSFDELDRNFVENYFSKNSKSFRALIFEFRHENRKLKLNRDLTEIFHFSIEIVVSCSKQIQRDEESIYIFHQGEIVVERENRNCSAIFVPIDSSSTTTTTIEDEEEILVETTTQILISSSKNDSLPIFLLIGGILTILTTILTCFYRKCSLKTSKIDEETSETNSEISTHDDEQSVESIEPKRNLPVTIKKPTKMMNSRLIWLDDL